MKNEKKKKKKGLWSVIRESMTKTGGCCGPGETCGISANKANEQQIKDEDTKELKEEKITAESS